MLIHQFPGKIGASRTGESLRLFVSSLQKPIVTGEPPEIRAASPRELVSSCESHFDYWKLTASTSGFAVDPINWKAPMKPAVPRVKSLVKPS
jgi:hypothetical protein